ncbi:hypothetical protein SAMN05192551_102371 [Tindallia magadiensis]|uniref:Uncharacterized protein n=1 Tax=Tindallia magadiensis TaxID=69895 RepID=A0A1I3CFB8_9FIRM|nr:hypothetical protein SAMN05192551_102371 [Tindallia magadiensis]
MVIVIKSKVLLEDCEVGMVLSEDLYNDSGLLLMKKGTILTPEKIKVLSRREVTEVPIEETRSN